VAQVLALHVSQELPLPETRDVNPLLSRDRAKQGDMIRLA
jgi:hypothetical protein